MTEEQKDTRSSEPNIDRGVNIVGDVNTDGGDFVGRDLTISNADDESVDIGQLEKRPYIIRVTEESSTFSSVYTAGGHFIGRDLIINNLEVKDIEHLRPEPCDHPCISPYQGLLRYEKEDADRFFGRADLTAQIVNRLHSTNCLTVIGASGSGKSSIVRAGVLPTLLGWTDMDDVNPLPGKWKELIMTPTSRPLSKIAEIIDSNDSTSQQNIKWQIQQTNNALAEALIKNISVDNHHRILVIDQFEELFTLCSDKAARQIFINNLLYLANNQQLPLKLIFILRADFYKQCLEYKSLAQLVENQIGVTPMTLEELAEVILRPAAKGEWKLQARLIDQILDDVGHEPGALPLLSHALLETWNRRRLCVMTLSGYREAGSVKGAIAHTAEMVYTKLTEDEQAIVKRLFLRLTEPGKESPDTRRKVKSLEIENDPVTRNVLQQLTQARLITADEEGLEVAHETLIREWPRLREWLDADRAGLLIHRRLTNATQTWQEKGEDASYLYTGLRLIELEQWAQSNSEYLNELEQAFLEASLLAENRRQRNRRLLLIGTTAVLTILFMLAIVAALINNARNIAVTARETAVAAQSTSDVNAAEAIFQAREADIARGTAEVAATTESEARSTAENSAITEGQARSTAVAAQSTAQADANRAINAEATAVAAQKQTNKQRQIMLLIAQSQALMNVRVPDNDAVAHARLMAVAAARIDQESTVGKNNPLVNSWNYQLIRDLNASYQPVTTLNHHDDFVKNVAWNAEGNLLASASHDKTIVIVEVASWQPSTTLKGHSGAVWSLAWSADDSRLASGDATGRIIIWDTTTWKPLATLDGHSLSVNSLAWNTDGSNLASASDVLSAAEEDNIIIWDTINWHPIATLSSGMFAGSVTWNPDGSRLAATSNGSDIIIWDTADWSQVSRLSAHSYSVNSVVWNPNGTLLASADDFGTITIWKVDEQQSDGWKPLTTLTDHTTQINSLSWDQSGARLASASGLFQDGTIIIWNTNNWQPIATLTDHSDIITSVAWNPDSTYLASASWDNSIIIWNTEVWQPYTLLADSADAVVIAWNNDSSRLVMGTVFAGTEEGVTMWDAISWRKLPNVPFESFGIHDLAWSADSSQIALASSNDSIIIWQADKNKLENWYPFTTLTKNTDEVRTVAWSVNGNYLASNNLNSVIIWDTTNWQPLAALNGHNGYVNRVLWSPDGQYLASVANEIIIWDTSNWKPLPKLTNLTDGFNSVAWNSDSSLLAAAGKNTIIIWDTAIWQPLAYPTGHMGRIYGLSWSPDGTRLASSSADRTIIIWDTVSWQPLSILSDHADTIWRIAWDTDGRRLASASFDGVIITNYPDSISLNCQLAQRNATWEEWKQSFPNEPYRAICSQWPIHPTVPTEEHPKS